MDEMLIDSREEVRKLQELVRKLEHQNQQLLKNSRDNGNGHTLNSTFQYSAIYDNCSETNKKNHILDEVDLIDIEDLELSDEDSWLYLSPKGLSQEDRAISAYKWLHRDVEDPYNRELQMARRALVYKLDELAVQHRLHGESLKNGCNSYGHAVDSRTFTRPKKKRDDSLEDKEKTYRGKTDFINVQEIARLQEESLRQSSPSSTPKRNSIGSTSSSGRRLSVSSRNSTDSEGQEIIRRQENGQQSVQTFADSLDNSSPGNLQECSQPSGVSSNAEPSRSSTTKVAKSGSERPGVRQLPKSRIDSPSRIGTFSPRIGLSPVRGDARLSCSSSNLRGISPLRSYRKGSSPEPARGISNGMGPPRNTRIPSPKSRSLGIPVPSRIVRPAPSSWNDGCF